MDLIEIKKIVSPDYDMDNERSRTLSANEIRELRDIFERSLSKYSAAPDRRKVLQSIELRMQHAIWIMLSTMCRVGETSMARWEHINWEARTWFIPKQNVKANLGNFTVYLSDFALDQFQQLHRVTGHSEWCFPAKDREGHICVKSISKQVGDHQMIFKKDKDGNPSKTTRSRPLDNSLVLSGGTTGNWTPHDMRRTGATLMQSLKVDLLIIDLCQNHVIPGSKTRRHYLHWEYEDEMREAWRRLGERLSLILNPVDNVVMLRTG
jgi:integrase